MLNAEGEPVKGPSAPAQSGEDMPATDAAGEQIVLSLHLLVNADNAFKVAAAEQLAASWNAVEGVSVTVDAVDYETFTARIREGSFDLYYGETRLTPDFDLRPLLTQGGSLNFGGYHDPDMESTLAAARKKRRPERALQAVCGADAVYPDRVRAGAGHHPQKSHQRLLACAVQRILRPGKLDARLCCRERQ